MPRIAYMYSLSSPRSVARVGAEIEANICLTQGLCNLNSVQETIGTGFHCVSNIFRYAEITMLDKKMPLVLADLEVEKMWLPLVHTTLRYTMVATVCQKAVAFSRNHVINDSVIT